jgi:hypothetical protein
LTFLALQHVGTVLGASQVRLQALWEPRFPPSHPTASNLPCFKGAYDVAVVGQPAALQTMPHRLPALQAVGTDAARSGSFAAGRSLLLAEPNSSESSSPSGEDGNSDSAAPSSRKKRCEPSLIDVARTQPELRQLVQLAIAGYNVFSVDGGKNFTVLAPTNAALQNLAAGESAAQGSRTAAVAAWRSFDKWSTQRLRAARVSISQQPWRRVANAASKLAKPSALSAHRQQMRNCGLLLMPPCCMRV